MNASEGMHSCEIVDGSFSEKSITFEMVFDINASNSPKISAFALEWNFQSLNKLQATLPPATVYSFSILVKVNLTPGYLSLIPISKCTQKYFSGEARNSIYSCINRRVRIDPLNCSTWFRRWGLGW